MGFATKRENIQSKIQVMNFDKVKRMQKKKHLPRMRLKERKARSGSTTNEKRLHEIWNKASNARKATFLCGKSKHKEEYLE